VRFESYQWFAALWAIPPLAALALFALLRARAALERFIHPGLLAKMAPSRSHSRRLIRATLTLAALTLVVIALARPQWNPTPREVKRRGRDVAFVIDVSRSMLAEDLAPSRLERAKLWVRDTLRVIQGDRVAIVAFAGTAVVKCPLTNDYGFARLALDDLSPDSVARGGTLIGDALRLTLSEAFDTTQATFKDIILITDGEDHESFPVEAARAAGQAGVRIIAVGIGDENEGKPIPITDENGQTAFLTYNGQRVLTRLDGATLRDMASASSAGVYLPVATGTIELDKVYEKLVKQAPQRDYDAAEAVLYEEKYQVFLAPAIALLFAQMLIADRKRAT